jgi:dipeptidyl aminopeptidase/acylaminoacyl peptidase
VRSSSDGRIVAVASDGGVSVIDRAACGSDLEMRDLPVGEAAELEQVGASGRFVALTLITGLQQAYAFDRVSSSLELVSRTAGNGPGDGPSTGLRLSDDGRFALFLSGATNLGAFAFADLLLRDRDDGSIERVAGGAADAAITADGGSIAFTSNDALIPEANGHRQLYYRSGGSPIECISRNTFGELASWDISDFDMTPDGRRIAFASAASNLVPNDHNDAFDIFVYDRDANTIERVTVFQSSEANGSSYAPRIDPSGRYIAFETQATNLGDALEPGLRVVRLDRSTGEFAAAAASRDVLDVGAVAADGAVTLVSDAAELNRAPGARSAGAFVWRPCVTPAAR